MQFFRNFTGIKAQLLYCLVLIIFIAAASTYLFSITSVEQKFFEARSHVLTFVDTVKHIQLPQPKLIQKAYAPTYKTPPAIATPTQTPSPEVIQNPNTQLTNCVGPDGKMLWLTQKDCDAFNDSWKNIPTPTSSATSSAVTN